ncbi:hypothetical protein BP6252_10893 [Coleophoma cylindrospora]|uniref:Oxidoreductase n=1 Tax=Coleophoma cylindrospora TaxID=1849047 RepID=A0A3D8QNU6_9HELO|nr:hypothetical protein BP6252_10893 [Coleophoma cylindrospora]
MVTRTEIQEHISRNSCWVILKGNVYDLTNFMDSHPGGSAVILKYAGRDATAAFEPIHRSDTLEKFLKPEQNLGPFTGSLPTRDATPQSSESKTGTGTSPEKKVKLTSIINIRDFEVSASKSLAPTSFAFLKTGSDDEYTAQWNRDSWKAIRLRPRILRPIETIDLSTSILGNTYSAPFFICPTGGSKLAHPTGDVLLTRAAAKHNVLHWVCNNAGCTQQEMTDARAENQTTYWQIYVMNDIAITEQEVKQAVANGYKGFALTVDAIRPGKRERDIRSSINDDDAPDSTDEEDNSFSNGPKVKRPPVWSSFDWVSSVKWLRGLTDLPIAIKGIQTWEDAALCMHYGVHPWLSNHGGRQLEGAPSAAETLVDIRRHCPEVFEKCEVIVDGGVTRGTDIVKALALGAKGVGLGRGFLYSLTFGEAGVRRAIRILKHEVEVAMALLGVTAIDQLNPSYVEVSSLAFASAFPRSYL